MLETENEENAVFDPLTLERKLIADGYVESISCFIPVEY